MPTAHLRPAPVARLPRPAERREHSLTELASRFSLSRERIRQLEIQALGRLRERARAEGLQATA